MVVQIRWYTPSVSSADDDIMCDRRAAMASPHSLPQFSREEEKDQFEASKFLFLRSNGKSDWKCRRPPKLQIGRAHV